MDETADIPTTNCIHTYIHCLKCLRTRPARIPPRQWQQIEAGWTEIGFQVWCKRHNANILHIDLGGNVPDPACDACRKG